MGEALRRKFQADHEGNGTAAAITKEKPQQKKER